jgi:hypothetical protein
MTLKGLLLSLTNKGKIMLNFKIKNQEIKVTSISISDAYTHFSDLIDINSWCGYTFSPSDAKDKIKANVNQYQNAKDIRLNFDNVKIKIYNVDYEFNHIRITKKFDYEARIYSDSEIYAFVPDCSNAANKLISKELIEQKVLERINKIKDYIARNKIKSELLEALRLIDQQIETLQEAKTWLSDYQVTLDNKLSSVA